MPEIASPPELPSHLLHGVGPGDFWAVGQHTVGLVRQLAHLGGASERVLDIGCGMGRVAWPLAQALDERSTYDGFDTLAPYVEACRERLALNPERYRFHHFDLHSSLYNPNGAIRSEDFHFPWNDGAFTLAIATSLFTHLTPAAATHYLREIARTLARGGRLYATFFVLDDHARELMRERPTDPDFRAPFPEGMYADAENPEAAVAFDAQWLLKTFLEAGYKIEHYAPGYWRRTAGAEYQDVVVASKT
ncbi:MAG TPA: class I SAM-dependent methyltransferase [Thermoanaerobaculia bacterium]|nr:class I SAM-dependent methyltransferase [Thermoanaerobaculia bacterium]